MTKLFNTFSQRTKIILGGAALLIVGGLVGGAPSHGPHPMPAMAPAAPVSISSIANTSPSPFGDPIVTVRGQVSAIYGNNILVKDASGQTLVNIGGQGIQAAQSGLIAVGQTITVQGRPDNGAIRAMFLVTADNKAWAVGGHGGLHEGHDGSGDHGELRPPDDMGRPLILLVHLCRLQTRLKCRD